MSGVGLDGVAGGGAGGPVVIVDDGRALHGGEGCLVVADEQSVEDGHSDFPEDGADDEGASALGQHVLSQLILYLYIQFK